MHAQIPLMKRCVKALARQACKPLWRTFMDWQCEQCGCMNDEGSLECDICIRPDPTSAKKLQATAQPSHPPSAAVRGTPKLRKQRNRVSLRGGSLSWTRFNETPGSTVKLLLCDMLGKFNPKGRACCPYHLALAVVSSAASRMAAVACLPVEPCAGWQCHKCLALQDDQSDDEEQCNVCFHARAAEEDPDDEEARSRPADGSATSSGADAGSEVTAGGEVQGQH